MDVPLLSGARHLISRRNILAGFAIAAAYRHADGQPVADTPAETSPDPVFSSSGPNAELYGAAEGFPIPSPALARIQGNPFQPKYRVGAFSHFDELFPTRSIKHADTPWMFKREAADIHYLHRGKQSSIAEYLSRNPVTGLLIAKDDRIFFEHYQYGRTDRDRLISQSMVKSIVGMLIGIAVSEGAIRSVADTAETYVPGFKGSEYGKTQIRDLLHMSSGVDFGEERNGGSDLNRLWRDMVARPASKGTIESIVQFNHRIASPGTRFYYASIEPDVLGMVLHYAVKQSLSDYLYERVWEPIGAEANANWLLDAQDFELAHFGFNAVLRDYARLGRLLAYDGAWEDRQIIPAQWMLDATTVTSTDSFLAPDKAMQTPGYGYLLWLLPAPRRQFAMVGALGQRVCVDPASKLVLVQTALEESSEIWDLWRNLAKQFD
jgi:CubicO group peptidase (beta-lactamase class C family)